MIVEYGPVNNYMLNKMTFFIITIVLVEDYEIDHTRLHDIGNKVDGKFLPIGKIIQGVYNNVSGGNKKLTIKLETDY